MAPEKIQDDATSCCGSITGETYYTTRRRRNTCTLRSHSIDGGQSFKNRRFSALDSISNIQEHCYDQEDANNNNIKHEHQIPPSYNQPETTRFNKSFHYYRFVVVMMGGFSFGLMILLRFNISVAILNMVNQTALYLADNPDKTVDDFLAEGYSLGGEFEWDNEIQQMIMSLYMFAYTLPQVFTTKLGIIIGSRLATPISLALCAISTILTPLVAYQGWRWVVLLRLVNGVGASAVLPLMLNLIESWMPYDQITLGLTCAQILQASLVTANPLVCGLLSSIHWSYAFYVPGVVTLIFSLLWLVMITDQPDENWLISQKELDLICGCSIESNEQSTVRETNGCCEEKQNSSTNSNSNQQQEKTSSGSWKEVFGMSSFYAYIFMWILYCSTYNCFSFILPTYLRQFLKISVAENGIFCAMIQSGCIVSVLWPHPMMEALKKNLQLSNTGSRRATYVLLSLMVSGTWIYVGLFHESQLLLLFLNRCFQSSTDIVITGSIMSNFAKAGLSGLVFSMVNTVGNLSLVVSSPLVGKILDMTGQSREGWCWIFSAMGCAQLLILLAFGTMVRSDPIEFKKNSTITTKKATSKTKVAKSDENKRSDTIAKVDLEHVKVVGVDESLKQ